MPYKILQLEFTATSRMTLRIRIGSVRIVVTINEPGEDG